MTEENVKRVVELYNEKGHLLGDIGSLRKLDAEVGIICGLESRHFSSKIAQKGIKQKAIEILNNRLKEIDKELEKQ